MMTLSFKVLNLKAFSEYKPIRARANVRGYPIFELSVMAFPTLIHVRPVIRAALTQATFAMLKSLETKSCNLIRITSDPIIINCFCEGPATHPSRNFTKTTFTLLFSKFVQDMYHILSESAAFCDRYDRNNISAFFGSQCI